MRRRGTITSPLSRSRLWAPNQCTTQVTTMTQARRYPIDSLQPAAQWKEKQSNNRSSQSNPLRTMERTAVSFRTTASPLPRRAWTSVLACPETRVATGSLTGVSCSNLTIKMCNSLRKRCCKIKPSFNSNLPWCNSRCSWFSNSSKWEESITSLRASTTLLVMAWTQVSHQVT